MSRDDVAAEHGNAGPVFGATGHPLVGLTLAGNGAWSARFWERMAARTYPGQWCGTVRIVGESLKVYYMDNLAPPPRATRSQLRTDSAWGEDAQADLARLRVGVVGAGRVGAFIAQGLRRTGLEDVIPIDFEQGAEHNPEPLTYA